MAHDASNEAPDLSALSALAPELAATFVSISSDIALVIDPTGVIRSVAVGREPLTMPTAEWVGRPWAETVTSDTRRKIEQLLSEVNTSGVSRRREVNHPSPNGIDVPIAYAAIRLGEDGPVLAVGRDLRAVAAIQQRFIDAQQEMERTYWRHRQSESRYRMLFQVATDAVMVIEADTQRVVEVNPAACQLFGLDNEQLVGQLAGAGIDRVSRPMFDELLAMARATGRPSEIRVRAQRGPATGSGLIDISATPLRTDDAMLLLVRAREVEAPVAAQVSIDRLTDFVERTPDAVVITDSSGRVQMANPAFIDLCRLRAEVDVTGRTLADVLGDLDHKLATVLNEVRRHGIAAHWRATIGHARSLAFDVEVSAALLDEGEQESIGLTLRRIDNRGMPLPQVGELASAVALLAMQMGMVPLPDLLQEATHLAERHLIEVALSRTHGDSFSAAQLLGISRESLALRVQRLGLGRAQGGLGDHGGADGTPPKLLN